MDIRVCVCTRLHTHTPACLCVCLSVKKLQNLGSEESVTKDKTLQFGNQNSQHIHGKITSPKGQIIKPHIT